MADEPTQTPTEQPENPIVETPVIETPPIIVLPPTQSEQPTSPEVPLETPPVSPTTPTLPNPPTVSEPTPVVVPASPPIDVPIPNFRFPFNGDFPVTFPFNSQPTTDEMKAKFQQWEISGHHGIDFGLPEGTEVLAVDAGKVFQSSENGDYGNSVTIQHPWGQSLYAHLKETKVSEGQEVNSGDLIGISGQTGAAFGPHLHFGIKPNNPNETNGCLGFIDPTSYLPAISQSPNIPNPPNLPDNPVPELEKPKEETPAPEIKVEEPKPETPIPDVSINIEPIGVSPQPSISSTPPEPVVDSSQIQEKVEDPELNRRVDEQLKMEIEARRLKANETRKSKREEHLQTIERFLQNVSGANNEHIRDLLHVSQTSATRYLHDLVQNGRIKSEGKGKATIYKNIFS